jgi:hypothetical protein
VLFMDFGNREHVGASAVRPMPPALAAVPGQAHAACLAFLRAPGVEEEHGVDAAQQLWQLVGGNRRLVAHVERRERLAAPGKQWGAAAPTKLHLTLMEPGSDDYAASINGQLLAAGLARLAEPKGQQVGTLRAAGGGGVCFAGACVLRRWGLEWAAKGLSTAPPLAPPPQQQRRAGSHRLGMPSRQV